MTNAKKKLKTRREKRESSEASEKRRAVTIFFWEGGKWTRFAMLGREERSYRAWRLPPRDRGNARDKRGGSVLNPAREKGADNDWRDAKLRG